MWQESRPKPSQCASLKAEYLKKLNEESVTCDMWPITGWAKQHLLNTCWLISQWYYSNCHWNSATRNKHVHIPITPSTLQLPNMGKPPFHTVPDDAEHWSQPQMRTTNYNTEKYSILQTPLPQKEAVGYVIWLTPREKGVCQRCYAVSEMMDVERQQMRTHSGLRLPIYILWATNNPQMQPTVHQIHRRSHKWLM